MNRLILLLLLSFSAHAQDSATIEAGVYTDHLMEMESPNEDNRLVAVEYNVDRWYFNASTFVNTFDARSFTVGSGYKMVYGHGVSFDLLWGVVTGYEEGQLKTLCTDSACLYIAPRLSYQLHITDNVAFKPSVKLLGAAVVVAVGVEYRFN
jgi:putative salt-induced outer membrane protein YdiY